MLTDDECPECEGPMERGEVFCRDCQEREIVFRTHPLLLAQLKASNELLKAIRGRQQFTADDRRVEKAIAANDAVIRKAEG